MSTRRVRFPGGVTFTPLGFRLLLKAGHSSTCPSWPLGQLPSPRRPAPRKCRQSAASCVPVLHHDETRRLNRSRPPPRALPVVGGSSCCMSDSVPLTECDLHDESRAATTLVRPPIPPGPGSGFWRPPSLARVALLCTPTPCCDDVVHDPCHASTCRTARAVAASHQ